MTGVLHTEAHGPVRLVTLNRPDSRNSLSAEIVGALSAELRSADTDPVVRAIVLTGTDPASCAGLDLKALAADGADHLRIFEDNEVIRLIGKLHTPVIGAAFTGGLEMALGCDFLVASERAVFADTHARVGRSRAAG